MAMTSLVRNATEATAPLPSIVIIDYDTLHCAKEVRGLPQTGNLSFINSSILPMVLIEV
jgi:hypothetical protein